MEGFRVISGETLHENLGAAPGEGRMILEGLVQRPFVGMRMFGRFDVDGRLKTVR